MQNRLDPHVWWIKIQKGYLGSEKTQPHTRTPSLGFQCPEDKFLTTSGCKNQWGLSWWKKLLEPQAVPLKEPTNTFTYSDSLPWSSRTW